MRFTTAALKTEFRRRIDWPLFGSALILLLVGMITLYSASAVQPGHAPFWKQTTWLVLAIPAFALFLFMDPRSWGFYRWWLYGISIGMMLFVDLFGAVRGGAQRWFDLGPLNVQPSEIAKIILILTLADLIVRKKDTFRTFRTFSISLLHVLPIFILVLRQPDLGTSLVLICIWLGMSLVAGQKLRYLAGFVLAAVGFFALAWNTPIIREYQKERIRALVSGEGSYHTKVAELSIAYGRVVGVGYSKGALKESGLVPAQTTDFIFTVVAEEGGFIASVLIVGLYALFLWRVWLVVLNSTVLLFRYMAAGIFVVYSFHVLVNLGMVVGLLPVVGVPLPFMSYGGTAMVLNFALLGLLLNLRSREKNLVF